MSPRTSRKPKKELATYHLFATDRESGVRRLLTSSPDYRPKSGESGHMRVYRQHRAAERSPWLKDVETKRTDRDEYTEVERGLING